MENFAARPKIRLAFKYTLFRAARSAARAQLRAPTARSTVGAGYRDAFIFNFYFKSKAHFGDFDDIKPKKIRCAAKIWGYMLTSKYQRKKHVEIGWSKNRILS